MILFFESVTVFSDNVKRRCGEHQHQNYYCCGIHTAKTGPNDTRRYKCTNFVEIKKPHNFYAVRFHLLLALPIKKQVNKI